MRDERADVAAPVLGFAPRQAASSVSKEIDLETHLWTPVNGWMYSTSQVTKHGQDRCRYVGMARTRQRSERCGLDRHHRKTCWRWSVGADRAQCGVARVSDAPGACSARTRQAFVCPFPHSE